MVSKMMKTNGEIHKIVKFSGKCRQEIWVNGQLHSTTQPAISWDNGDQEWRYLGQKHRENDLPAVICKGVKKEWWINGKLHRLNGPAIEWENGKKEWYVDGIRHRMDGPAVIYDFGGIEWWQNGQLHRVGGPAVIDYKDTQMWYDKGVLHRENGPAVIYRDGKEEHWIHGHKVKNNTIVCPLCRQVNTSYVSYNSDEKCLVCWDNLISTQLSQCGHHCLCQSCLDRLQSH